MLRLIKSSWNCSMLPLLTASHFQQCLECGETRGLWSNTSSIGMCLFFFLAWFSPKCVLFHQVSQIRLLSVFFFIESCAQLQMASCCKGSLKGGAGGISVPFHLSSTSCARRHPAIGRLLSLTQPIVFLISPLPYTSCSLRSCHKLCLCSLALYLTSPSLHWAFPPPYFILALYLVRLHFHRWARKPAEQISGYSSLL